MTRTAEQQRQRRQQQGGCGVSAECPAGPLADLYIYMYICVCVCVDIYVLLEWYMITDVEAGPLLNGTSCLPAMHVLLMT